MASGGTVAAQISLFNSVGENLSLVPTFSTNPAIQQWGAYDYFCNGYNQMPMLGYALFQGDYSGSNVSAGTPMQLAPFVELPCATWPNPTSITFLPESDNAIVYGTGSANGTLEPLALTASTESCTWNGAGGVCGPGNGMSGYWNTTAPLTQQQATLSSPYFRYFSPGEYTLVVEDVWGQTVYAHFQVVSAPGSPAEVLSVMGPIPPYNPGGPVVSIALENVGDAPIASLNATLQFTPPSSNPGGIPVLYKFVFRVNASEPLLPGQSTIVTETLIGAGFQTGVSYPLTISGILATGTAFSYTVLVQIVLPANT